MLIRVKGYNAGVKEYLEEGVKNGRDFTREELDERVILYGDLELTDIVYNQIQDKGQDRYLTITLAFREDEIPIETLNSVTSEFKDFLMHAYKDEEYNFYAEAHIPKIKQVEDKRTGDLIDRKPHIHIVIPKKNLLSGRAIDPVGSNFNQSMKHIEAFQEYINQKYDLASPRDHVRVNPTSVADVLSRYKGDDFRGKNREFKQNLIADIINNNISTKQQFYDHVQTFGEVKIRNQGRDTEYIAVRLPNDQKFTNLKESIFGPDFIERREVKKEPLSKKVINDRLSEWPQRAKEIKYVSKATPSFRTLYKESNQAEKLNLLADRQYKFYEKYGDSYELYPTERQSDNQRSSNEVKAGRVTSSSDGLQSMPSGSLAVGGKNREGRSSMFLSGTTRLDMGRQQAEGSTGLRHALRSGRGGTGSSISARTFGNFSAATSPNSFRTGGRTLWTASRNRPLDLDHTIQVIKTEEPTVLLSGRGRRGNDLERYDRIKGVDSVSKRAARYGFKVSNGFGRLDAPPYAANKRRVAGFDDIEKRTALILGNRTPKPSSPAVKALLSLAPKPPKDASFVASYFLKKHGENKILPAHRHEIRLVDNLYFNARRMILTDNRFSKGEKTQYLGVLLFERLKAHQEIIDPQSFFQEIDPMGSAEIRERIKSKPKLETENTISGPEGVVPPAHERFRRLISSALSPKPNAGRATSAEEEQNKSADDKGLDFNGLYTKRAKFSQSVHYLEKTSDKTVFVDTGKSIAVRKGGMSAPAVEVALQLAKEKFGSTLTIKGTDEFKNQVIEVAAKNNMDIHFTDPDMNKALRERKTELEIEREGQSINEPEINVDLKTREDAPIVQTEAKNASEPDASLKKISEAINASPAVKLLDSLAQNSPSNLASAGPAPAAAGTEEPAGPAPAAGGTEEPAGPAPAAAGTEEPAGPAPATTGTEEPAGPAPATASATRYFKDEILIFLEKTQKDSGLNRENIEATAERAAIKTVDDIDFWKAEERYPVFIAAAEAISKLLGKGRTQEPGRATEIPAKDLSAKTKQNKITSHEGILLEHGRAPYKNKLDLNKPEHERVDSYFVKLKTPAGRTRTLWGVDLENASQGLKQGERVQFEDKGVEHKTWSELQTDGTYVEKSGNRRSWEGTPLDREKSVESPARDNPNHEEDQEGPSLE